MKRFVVAGFMALAIVAPAGAHHSISAEFDSNRPVTFTGTVTKIEWTNPHIYTHVEVKEPDGKTTVYRVEGGAPNTLFRQGWRKDTLKIGESVSVTGIRAKNPASVNIGQATILTAEGKRVFGGGGGGGGAAAPPANQ